MTRPFVTVDGNEAAAYVAHQLSEVIAIYPITPSSPMGEWADQWSSEERTNVWGSVPAVIEMQSEGGAAGAVHGALQAGALTTTFTSSQGLLLMIPNMYKIAGELSPTVLHVAARSLAAQGLSIFGDHQDVMAVRGTGFALLAAHSVQAVMDLAAIAHAASLESRVPFLHFFDGFRTSHEVQKIELLRPDDLRALVPDALVRAHRERALSPDHPVIRGTAQNPDVYFQGREAANSYYLACPATVARLMGDFEKLTGRRYQLFDYHGAPDAERVMVIMGSAAQVVEETVDALCARGEKVGVLNVHLYRPFSVEAFSRALPASVRSLAVLDRSKEPGALGEPLYLDVIAALHECGRPLNVIGGRYGLSSKGFTPGMVAAIFQELGKASPAKHFTVGIHDDVTRLSLTHDPEFSVEPPETVKAVFFGLGSDGTVGANKNSIKIIGEDTPFHAQGYFVYDSKKSGSITTSHLRFGPHPIRAQYLIRNAGFVACHQFSLLTRTDVLGVAAPGATFLLNSPYGPEEVWEHLPRGMQQAIIDRKLHFWVIDGYGVAKENGMGGRINTVMQTCFFALSGVLPREQAIAAIKKAIAKTYGKRGEAVVAKNHGAVDATLAHLHQVEVPGQATAVFDLAPPVPAEAPGFVREVLGEMIAGRGDQIPVSRLPVDGTYPTGTSRWEKRNIASEIPVWERGICIQCGKCVLVCPHGVIRARIYSRDHLADAPASFAWAEPKWKEYAAQAYTLQVAPEDCTGCGLCVEICPAKSKTETRIKAIHMEPQAPLRETERRNWEFFLALPETPREDLHLAHVKDVQLLEPLFEFSGACAGCGETPYVKLLTQLFGDRALIANATGCSSIYGGNLPTTPYTTNETGRGPAWSNSLFEDNAEFGLGMRLAVDKQNAYARELLEKLAPRVGADLARDIETAGQRSEAEIQEQRTRIGLLKEKLRGCDSPDAANLLAVADSLVRRSVWLVGGDGWAYDIGFGGLDHVFASGRNVNILVLDTEVYSNTGGQMSKSTPRGAVAKFAAGGKTTAKKDLALMAMSYGDVYVARIAMGASDTQTVKAFLEAEAFDGPSLILAYSHCIAHGYDLRFGLEQQKAAVKSGYWPLFRYNPALAGTSQHPMQLDSREPAMPLSDYVLNEGRYSMLAQTAPEDAARLIEEAQRDVERRWKTYQHWATMPVREPES